MLEAISPDIWSTEWNICLDWKNIYLPYIRWNLDMILDVLTMHKLFLINILFKMISCYNVIKELFLYVLNTVDDLSHGRYSILHIINEKK